LNWDEWQRYFRGQEYHQTCPGIPPHPTYLTQQIEQADEPARQGQIDQALAAYARVRELDPLYLVGAQSWNTLCRAGALWGRVKDVLDACGQAVALNASSENRDSRGIARALTGDSSGAIEDFAAYIASAKQTRRPDLKAIAQHEQWIADLQAGRQPFNQATLKALREAEVR
jgi:hypothetical protein